MKTLNEILYKAFIICLAFRVLLMPDANVYLQAIVIGIVVFVGVVVFYILQACDIFNQIERGNDGKN